MFLAEGVAAVGSAMAGTGSPWDQWLSPTGVAAALGLVTTMLAILSNLASAAGKKDLAARLDAARGEVGDKQEQAQTSAALLRTVIQGVEAAKGGMSPDARLRLVTAIQSVSKEAGMEAILSPLVVAVTKQGASPVEVAATLADVVGKLAAAQPIARPTQGSLA